MSTKTDRTTTLRSSPVRSLSLLVAIILLLVWLLALMHVITVPLALVWILPFAVIVLGAGAILWQGGAFDQAPNG